MPDNDPHAHTPVETAKPYPLRLRYHFVQVMLPRRFKFGEGGMLEVVTTNGICGRNFEDLSHDEQVIAIQSTGFEPERLAMSSVGGIVGAIRAGQAWLDADPIRTVDDLRELIANAPHERQTS